MRLSLVTPVLTCVPGSHARWEEAAGMAELVEIARTADRLGYHHLTCSEHVAIPTEVAKVRGATYWDPLATFGYLAAVTERVRLATYVLVLGYHHPLEIAKRYGTLDLVSGGRLILGVGVGSLREEFELLDAPFADRGARADDALVALRASLSQEQPVYHGTHYDYGGVVVRPSAVQPRLPLWVGGRTRRSLRRAAALADGWAPFGVSVAQVADWVAGVERPDGFEVVISPERALDPSDAASACTDALGALAAAGTTIVAARVVHHSLAHCLEQLEALAGLAATATTRQGAT
ncbi:MAG TPA: LLM class F420-dependent oxidoreductase [Acidimicrobiales bacterium]|jgi:probable F420-dependent oxidoreductase